jgi:hypothetical protein
VRQVVPSQKHWYEIMQGPIQETAPTLLPLFSGLGKHRTLVASGVESALHSAVRVRLDSPFKFQKTLSRADSRPQCVEGVGESSDVGGVLWSRGDPRGISSEGSPHLYWSA